MDRLISASASAGGCELSSHAGYQSFYPLLALNIEFIIFFPINIAIIPARLYGIIMNPRLYRIFVLVPRTPGLRPQASGIVEKARPAQKRRRTRLSRSSGNTHRFAATRVKRHGSQAVPNRRHLRLLQFKLIGARKAVSPGLNYWFKVANGRPAAAKGGPCRCMLTNNSHTSLPYSVTIQTHKRPSRSST